MLAERYETLKICASLSRWKPMHRYNCSSYDGPHFLLNSRTQTLKLRFELKGACFRLNVDRGLLVAQLPGDSQHVHTFLTRHINASFDRLNKRASPLSPSTQPSGRRPTNHSVDGRHEPKRHAVSPSSCMSSLSQTLITARHETLKTAED